MPETKTENASISKKHYVYALSRQAGLEMKEAGELAGYSKSHMRSGIYKTERKISKSFLDPLKTLAKKSVKATLKGQPVGMADFPKAGDVMRAAELVLDRVDPKINQNLNISVGDNSLTQEERLQFLQVLGLSKQPDEIPIIDIPPQDVVLEDDKTKRTNTVQDNG